jgi:lipid-A-disaccharide synthase
MTGDNPLRVYFVVGEESGDVLGTKLIDAFEELGSPVKPMGLAGAKMQDKGMDSLFDIAELSVMGISAVVKNLPNLLKRIRQTVDDILAKKPDVLLLIDSPDFSYRVAKKVRQEAPNIKIIKYVAPTVWAWRSGRAKKIKPYIDHIMAILPFEPQLLKKLGGPEATYVGHPLASELPNIQTANKMACHDVPRLVILPGSRKGELKLMLPVIRETIQILHERGNKFELVLPAVTRLEADIRQETSGWIIKPTIVMGEEAKKKAFTNADLALATSGTVILELALYKVPMVSIYKLDKMMMAVRHMITAWTTLLPNLIVDYPFIPEKINENAHPEHLARMLERLMMSGEERNVQLKGFELLEEKLASEQLGAKVAARKIIELLA